MKIIFAFLISIIVAPISGVVPLLFIVLLTKNRAFLTSLQVKYIGWIGGISHAVFQVWIISLIFKWITNANPYFIFLVIFIFIEVTALNSQVNSGPIKLGALVGTAIGLILGWLIFI